MDQHPFWLDHLPVRPQRPRSSGLNLVRDNGRSYDELRLAIEAYGRLLDFMKFRQFVVWYLPLDDLRRKVALCQQHGIRTFAGGTVLEAAHLHDATDQILDAMAEIGFTSVEISHSVVPLSSQQLAQVVARARQRGLEVLFEYGNKSQELAFDTNEAAEDIRALTDAGADYVIVERRQLDAALGPDGSAPTAGRIIELGDLVGVERLIFEAETLAHQSWLIKAFGTSVNLGPNIDPFHIPAQIEPMRHGLGRWVGWGLFDHLLADTGADQAGLFTDE